ncbi:hypothetical protein PGB90_007585 [Kerria lacca]
MKRFGNVLNTFKKQLTKMLRHTRQSNASAYDQSSQVDTMPTDLFQNSPDETTNVISTEKIQLRKRIGVLEGVAIIFGIILGSGAICYAELGTTILKSGGDYAYIYECYGSLPAFLYLWDAVIVFVPTTNAIMGLTFANYTIQPFFSNCPLPETAVKLLAAVIINTGTSYDLKWEDTTTHPGKIAIAFYLGIFCYSGWNYLNFMTEELKDPYVNLPRAIYISVPVVTIVYVLTNISYFAVLTPQEMISSSAVAVTFGNRIFGSFEWIVSFVVAIGAAGSLSVHIMTSSRSNKNLQGILSLLMLFMGDVNVLITYVSFVESFFIMLSVASILYLRWKQPNLHRPIKVPLILPILFVIVAIFLVILPCFVKPVEVGTGILITLIGIPVYYIFVYYKEKPQWYNNSVSNFTIFIQKLLLSTKEDN